MIGNDNWLRRLRLERELGRRHNPDAKVAREALEMLRKAQQENERLRRAIQAAGNSLEQIRKLREREADAEMTLLRALHPPEPFA